MPSKRRRNLVLVGLGLILAVALFVRLYRLTWDSGYLFHPDERQILFVTYELTFPWPPDWGLLLSPASPWNPAFFAYGSLPIYLLRISASIASLFWPDFASPRSFYVIGRVFSVLADVGTVALVFALGRKLYDDAVGLLAAAFLTLTVLHVQLSHFYAVDTLLGFFVMLVLFLAVRAMRRPRIGHCVGLGVVYGLALATKISALPLAVPLAVAWVGAVWHDSSPDDFAVWRERAGWIAAHALRGLVIMGWVALFTFVLMQPYAVIDLSLFLEDVIRESMMARGTLDLPYTRQFIGTPPYLYLIWQTVVWSMGAPLGIIGFAGALAALGSAVHLAMRGRWRRLIMLSVPLAWFWVYFGLVGSFHAKFLRYMVPLIPLLCLWGAAALVGLIRARSRWLRHGGWGLAILALVASGVYVMAYLNVYSATHPWVQATEWICREIPGNSVLMVEHWDHPLPMLQGRGDLDCVRDYRYVTFGGYYADDLEKLDHLVGSLRASDYIILSSNRLYNSIPRLPERYPLTARYYELLMAEQLGFELVYFSQVYPELGGVRLVNDTFSDPALPMPRLLADEGRRPTDLVLGRADESYSVYDHPMPLVFRRVEELSRSEILARLGEAVDDLLTDATLDDHAE